MLGLYLFYNEDWCERFMKITIHTIHGKKMLRKMTAGLKDLGIRMSNLEYLRSKIVTAGLYKHLLGFFVDQWYSCSCLRDSVFDYLNHSKLTKSKDSVLSSLRNWNCVEEIQVLILSSMTKIPFLSHSDCPPLLSSFLSWFLSVMTVAFNIFFQWIMLFQDVCGTFMCSLMNLVGGVFIVCDNVGELRLQEQTCFLIMID